jgi:hypothetical protein
VMGPSAGAAFTPALGCGFGSQILRLLEGKGVSLLNQTIDLYPFRDADAPVRSLLEHVTVHEIGFTKTSDGLMVLRGKCSRSREAASGAR